MKIFQKTILALSSAVLLAGACGKGEPSNPRPIREPEDEPALVTGIQFTWDKIRTVPKAPVTVPVKEIHFDDGSRSVDPTLLKWSVEDESIATVDKNGQITAKKAGVTEVKAEADGIWASIPVYVTTGASTTGIDQFSADNIYDKGSALTSNQVPQSFDITRDGMVWYLQIGKPDVHRLYLNKVEPSAERKSEVKEWMAFDFFGHGTNYTLEEAADGLYVWISSFGTRTEDDTYWHEQVFGRFKYGNEKVVTAGDSDKIPEADYFYLGTIRQDIHVAVDVEGDDLMIYYADGHPEKPRHFVVYSLKEALASRTSYVDFRTRVYGGGTSEIEERENAPYIRVHDLSTIPKKAEFGFQGQAQAQAYVAGGGSPDDEAALSYYSYQGFDIHDGAIYFYEGEGKDGFLSKAYITVFNYAGQIIEKRTRVNIAENQSALQSNGITALGYMEAEGLKVRGGHLYISFGSNDYDDVRRGNLFKYNIARLQ